MVINSRTKEYWTLERFDSLIVEKVGGLEKFSIFLNEPQAANKFFYRRFKQEGVGGVKTFLGSLENRSRQVNIFFRKIEGGG